MPVSTASAAVHITPVVLKTFLRHGKRRRQREADKVEAPQDVIFFDQSVSYLRRSTNTHIPSPYWAAVSPVCIPLTTCNESADVLIKWFGPQELKYVVGGERWWQVRGLNGLDGEWIAEREHLDQTEDVAKGRKLRSQDEDILRMEKLESVMLYIHGGGYFWGSLNTHRFQILRYARKFKGRAFAVNYRKAPQYPWPCPLQDVLAAYLYLIRPPPGALHAPAPPSKIVLAGDSAGGGLCVTVMTVLRDIGLPMPAGADILPLHGFLAKPSTLWPLEPIPFVGPRVAPSETNPPPKPGHTDTLKPTEERLRIAKEALDVPKGGYAVKTQEEIVSHNDEDDPEQWKPKPPKVFMENPTAVPLELRCQIQMYALSEQVTHPLVSPILQGSLGNLPPLYILAGDGEMLRDEIIYLAHRAALPSEYPVRPEILKEARRQADNANKFTKPTKVHLQVFDGMCHVLTVFMFEKSARYAYRSIAEFVKHVTQNGLEHLDRKPFPEFRWTPEKNPTGDTNRNSESVDSATSSQKSREQDEKDAEDLYKSNADILTESVSQKPPRGEPGNLARGEGGNENIGSANVDFISERVSIRAVVRPMEAKGDIPALQVSPSCVGVIKEAPAMRWLRGQERWDQKFAKAGARVLRERKGYEERAERLIERALAQGLVHEAFPERDNIPVNEETKPGKLVKKKISPGKIQADRRWGPLDLQDERPPPSAIAGRRDNRDSLALLRQSIYYSAPVTHKTVPRWTSKDTIRAAIDPHDDTTTPPKQSVAEQQVSAAPVTPLNGLRMWNNLLTYVATRMADIYF
ncbi:lipase/esterase [Coprinopsis marcescibilis]|uniref:Lipase/esterase n=1 Tax=Coprinopsis marcescibilis TaxID=230819 RepID=A0A5C3KPC5_COPMA|nr:lipase/esterase [Coprinopsis marcescibilis]